MCTPSVAVQLALLEKKIDETIEDLSPSYPFLASDRVRSKKQNEDDQRTDELALRTLKEISESLSL